MNKKVFASMIVIGLLASFTGCQKTDTSIGKTTTQGAGSSQTETCFLIGENTSEYFSCQNLDYSVPDQKSAPIVYGGMLSDTSVWALVVSDTTDSIVYLEQFDFDGHQKDVIELGSFQDLEMGYDEPYMYEDDKLIYIVSYPSKETLSVCNIDKQTHEKNNYTLTLESEHVGDILGYRQGLLYIMNLNDQGELSCCGYDISTGECKFQSQPDSEAQNYIWNGDHLLQLNRTSKEGVYQVYDLSAGNGVSYCGDFTAPIKWGKFHYYNGEQFFDNETGIWCLNKSTGTWDNIILWENTGIDKTDSPSDIRIASKNHDMVLALGRNMKNISLFKVGADPKVGKTSLLLVGQYIPEEVIWAIQKYNSENSQYVIEYKTFEDLLSSDDYLDQDGWIDFEAYDNAIFDYLWKAIRNGDGPDILLRFPNEDGSRYDSRFYEFGGLLQDLAPFVEKENASWKELYYSNLFQVMKNGECLYSIPYSFEMVNYVISGNDKSIADIQPTYSEWLKYMDANANGRVLLPMAGQDYLRESLIFDSASFIDEENHVSLFSSQEFKDLLRLAKDYCMTIDEWNNGNSREAVLSTNRIQGDYIKSIINQYDHSLEGPFYGLISKDGGHACLSCESISITSNCKDTNAAWEFIKLLLSSDVQEYSLHQEDSSSISRSRFPVLRSSVDYLLDFEVNPKDHEAYWEYYYSDVEADWSIEMLTPIAKEDAQKVHDFIAAVDYVSYCDIEIIDVVMEETAPFFAGQKSIDDVVSIIDNRVQTILGERQQ